MMGFDMGIYRKKRNLRLFIAVVAILFLGCLCPDLNIFAREREQYTSVTVELRDADTEEVFHTYVHPWQRVGKKYTYYAEEQICQEGKGCYWYDEAHEGAVPEIASLSQRTEENRVILYYKLYDMGKEEYAVNVAYKDADTGETIKEEVRNLGELGEPILSSSFGHDRYYSIDMDCCIVGNDGKAYLYDTKNENNIPIIKIDRNPERNQIILYYREGSVQEGEAVAEIYYVCEDSRGEEEKYLAKSYVFGLSIGESYTCEDEEILQAQKKYKYDPDGDSCIYYFYEGESSLSIDSLSPDSKDNIIKIYYDRKWVEGGIPSQYRFSTVTICYKNEDTGDAILEDAIEVKQKEMFQYRPPQVFYGRDGRVYYLDNTKEENVLRVNPRNSDIDESKGKAFCREQVTAYYRPVRKAGEAADVCVNYLDASTGKMLKTEMLPNAIVGSAYSHTPKKTFAVNGKLYTFDRKNAGNDLALKTASGHPDIDWADAYYTGKSLKKILKAPKIKKLSRKGSGKASVQIEKVKGVSGYQIMYAYNKKFKSAKKASSASLKITLKKLKTSKKCYVKVRAYIKTDEGKVYGPYSKRKALK